MRRLICMMVNEKIPIDCSDFFHQILIVQAFIYLISIAVTVLYGKVLALTSPGYIRIISYCLFSLEEEGNLCKEDNRGLTLLICTHTAEWSVM